MKHRKLRIAWSVAWGIACLLLVAWWVRSYWHADDVVWVYRANMYGLESAWGSLRPFYNGTGSWPGPSWVATERISESQLAYEHSQFGWDDKDYPTYFMAYFPHWIPALIFSVCAAGPWFSWSKRFSLRTLLIATTLVGIILGLIVWLRS